MAKNSAGKRDPDLERTPFASWLDSMMPAVFANDAEFARKLGVPQSYVHYWRRGRTPQVPALVKMSKLTGTSIETLMKVAGYQTDDETESS